jgi:hypothetical protein
MPLYRERPRVVDAFRYTGANRDALRDWLKEDCLISEAIGGGIVLHTREGNVTVRDGDWAVRGRDGITLSTCAADEFARSYEPLPASSTGAL